MECHVKTKCRKYLNIKLEGRKEKKREIENVCMFLSVFKLTLLQTFHGAARPILNDLSRKMRTSLYDTGRMETYVYLVGR